MRLQVGAVLPTLSKGRLTSSHIVRWCAAQKNWAKIHYDESYARGRAKLPGTLINGALKQHLLVQFLTDAFEAKCWVWRIDYQFMGLDLVGQELQIRGVITEITKKNKLTFITVNLECFNTDTNAVTTKGQGIVIIDQSDAPLKKVIDMDLPEHLKLNERIEPVEGEVASNIQDLIGQELDHLESYYPLDLSRLSLFADAIMGLHPMHFDPKASVNGPYGIPVAPPLFPLHGIELLPGTYTLSTEHDASGREGVVELPFNIASRFGISPAGSLNGGSKIEIYSLLPIGGRVVATSKLVGAKHKIGRSGTAMLIFETINKFRAFTGEPLLTERHSSIYRL